MHLDSKFSLILALFLFTLLLNLPFGYARVRSKRYSLRWFLYIHMPIPIIFILRTISHVEIKYIPVVAIGAVIGQVLGGKLEI
jgi:hypothetical protein